MPLNVTVDVTEYLGGTAYVYGTTGGGAALVIEARGQDELRHGEGVVFGIDPARCYFLDPQGNRLR